MQKEDNWVRSEIIQTLRSGYSRDEQASIEQQTDALMELLKRIASETDTYHLLVGYLNKLRLDVVRDDSDG